MSSKIEQHFTNVTKIYIVDNLKVLKPIMMLNPDIYQKEGINPP